MKPRLHLIKLRWLRNYPQLAWTPCSQLRLVLARIQNQRQAAKRRKIFSSSSASRDRLVLDGGMHLLATAAAAIRTHIKVVGSF